MSCDLCKKKYIEKEILSDEDKKLNRNIINNIKNSSLGQEHYILKYFPSLYKEINLISKNKDYDWSIKVYMYKNRLEEVPICAKNNCLEYVNFNHSMQTFNKFCLIHSNTSYEELKLKEYVEKYLPTKKYRDKNYELDIFIPSLNIGIEYNGIYWHSEKYKNKSYHLDKYNYFKNKNINIINVWEDDWKDKSKNDIIKSIIQNKLQKNTNKIYARKCKIKEVYSTKKFLNENHLQGWCQSSINIGLYYENELVSLMTFGKRKISKKTYYELLRFCNKKYTNVVGGASRLFSFFTENYNFPEIVSYANLDISNGNLYKILGFENKGQTGINYWWLVEGKRFHRSNFMKHKLISQGENPDKSEDQIMYERGHYKVYGSGNLKFIFYKK